MCRIISLLDSAGLKHETHLFLEGENAPANDVAAVIKRVYDEVEGDILVASRSNKVCLVRLLVSWDRSLTTSAASLAMSCEESPACTVFEHQSQQDVVSDFVILRYACRHGRRGGSLVPWQRVCQGCLCPLC